MRVKRFVSLTLALILLVSVFSISVFASNSGTTSVYNFVIPDNVDFRHTEPFMKMDSTPFYVYVTASLNPFVKVQANGYTGYTNNANSGTNVTWSEGEIVPYVICWRGTEYWVHQYVYENGFSYASAGFSAAYAYDEINFVWSPDTTTRYTSAIY